MNLKNIKPKIARLMSHMHSSIMSHMDINIGSKSYIKEKVTKQARITTKVLRRVDSKLPATVSEKLCHLDTLIYQVIVLVKTLRCTVPLPAYSDA